MERVKEVLLLNYESAPVICRDHNEKKVDILFAFPHVFDHTLVFPQNIFQDQYSKDASF